ncbi:MAG: 30S ribosomal protein S8 [Lentisphaerae bacterium]|jgi:small subunit ribosomal protein S8|nr:30S ribosomal protein S8 [Lentisphaerota bacterium]
MSLSDPIADMIVRVKNAQRVGHTEVEMPGSRLKGEIARVFQQEGYIAGFTLAGDPKRVLLITLKYGTDGSPAIRDIKRVSKPGLRRFTGYKDMPRVLKGLGTTVVTTSQGVMSGKEARQRKLGGEVICSIW